jgi:hypothetical protein
MIGRHGSGSGFVGLAGVPILTAAETLAELVDGNLVAENTAGRYTMHDLLRAYAQEVAHTTETEQWRQQAGQRMLDHYLRTGHAAALLLHPHRDPLRLDPLPPHIILDVVEDFRAANAWFATEKQVLLGLIELAATAGWDGYPWQLAWTLTNHLDRQGHWHEWATATTTALAAAKRLADLSGQAAAGDDLVGVISQAVRS